MRLTYVVKDSEYKTIKEVLRKHFNMSQRLMRKLKLNEGIILNNKNVYVDMQLNIGDILEIVITSEVDSSNVVPTKMDLDIIYEDDSILVINKPPKIAVHPSNLHYSTSLSNGVKYYYNSKGIKSKIHIVNRLDRDTSGVVVFAKNEYIQECLIKQMLQDKFHKEYISILTRKTRK